MLRLVCLIDFKFAFLTSLIDLYNRIVLFFTFFRSFYPHSKGEDTSLLFAVRMHADGATIDFNKVLGDHQAHANAFAVLLCCAPELAKHVKQLVQVIF